MAFRANKAGVFSAFVAVFDAAVMFRNTSVRLKTKWAVEKHVPLLLFEGSNSAFVCPTRSRSTIEKRLVNRMLKSRESYFDISIGNSALIKSENSSLINSKRMNCNYAWGETPLKRWNKSLSMLMATLRCTLKIKMIEIPSDTKVICAEYRILATMTESMRIIPQVCGTKFDSYDCRMHGLTEYTKHFDQQQYSSINSEIVFWNTPWLNISGGIL